MDRGLGTNILETQHLGGLIDNRAGNLAGRYFTKKAVAYAFHALAGCWGALSEIVAALALAFLDFSASWAA